MTVSKSVKLNNGVDMPLLGLGVYDMHGEEAETAIRTAIETGYRLIDTASLYHNEAETGRAVRDSPIPRKEIFITTMYFKLNLHFPIRINNRYCIP